MTYKTDNDIQKRLQEHLEYVLSLHDYDWFVICAQGSMNYNLMYEDSDVDSKLLVLPTLNDLVFNRKPVNNVTIVQPTDEHCDVKDIRTYFATFKKQNINFVEILFTPYFIVNEKYQDLWLTLREHAEELAHMNEYAAIKCMIGMASEKYHALTHRYPSRAHLIDKYGYDPKQLHHLVRLQFFIEDYTSNETYASCLDCSNIRDYLIGLKKDGNGKTKEQAELFAEDTLNEIKKIGNANLENLLNVPNEEIEAILDDVLYKAISRALKGELNDNLCDR